MRATPYLPVSNWRCDEGEEYREVHGAVEEPGQAEPLHLGLVLGAQPQQGQHRGRGHRQPKHYNTELVIK